MKHSILMCKCLTLLSLLFLFSCANGPKLEILGYSGVADFATVTLLTRKELTFTVHNPTQKNLVLGSISGAGLGLSLPFHYEGGSCSTRLTLAPAETCELVVSFAPVSQNEVSRELSISYFVEGKEKEKQLLLELKGKGYLDCGFNRDQAGCPQDRDLEVTPMLSTLEFDTVEIGASKEITFTITNIDEDDEISLKEISAESFGLDTTDMSFQVIGSTTTCTDNQTLPVGGSCQITIAFSPRSGSFYMKELKIPYNENNSLDGNEDETLNLNLQGKGLLNCAATTGLTDAKNNGVQAAELKMQQETTQGRLDGEALTYQQGHTAGYNATYTDNYNIYYNNAYVAYYDSSYTNAFNDYWNRNRGCNSGASAGDVIGREDGEHDGDYDGYTDGYDSAYFDGKDDGRADGYDDGYDDSCKINPVVVLPNLSNYEQSCYDQGYAETYVNQYWPAFVAARESNTDYTSGRTAGRLLGTNEGRSDGQADGRLAGEIDGDIAGLNDGYDDAYANCYDDHYISSYQIYYNSSYNQAFDEGAYDGYNDGYADGYDIGYDNGYDPTLCYYVEGEEYPLIQRKGLSTENYRGNSDSSRFAFGRSWMRMTELGTYVDVFQRSIPTGSSILRRQGVIDRRSTVLINGQRSSLREELKRNKIIEFKNTLRSQLKNNRSE